jgi:hypothetical protein
MDCRLIFHLFKGNTLSYHKATIDAYKNIPPMTLHMISETSMGPANQGVHLAKIVYPCLTGELEATQRVKSFDINVIQTRVHR